MNVGDPDYLLRNWSLLKIACPSNWLLIHSQAKRRRQWGLVFIRNQSETYTSRQCGLGEIEESR